MGLYKDALDRFTATPKKGEEMLGRPAGGAAAGRVGGAGGPGGPGSQNDDARQAALVVVANALLNLDEIITKN
jgi:hypothetical protein